LPTPEGLIPGAGSILAALEKATERKAKVLGKPFPDMFQLALTRLQVLPQETLAVGDQLETDIAGASAAGCLTALVLTGVSSREAASLQIRPTLIENNFSSLINKLAEWIKYLLFDLEFTQLADLLQAWENRLTGRGRYGKQSIGT